MASGAFAQIDGRVNPRAFIFGLRTACRPRAHGPATEAYGNASGYLRAANLATRAVSMSTVFSMLGTGMNSRMECRL